MGIESSFSRDQVAGWARLTRPQVNHMCNLGLIRAEIGQVRKRISVREAQMAAGAAAFMRLGMQPKDLIAPFDWLRDQLATDEKWEVRFGDAVDGIPEIENLPEYAITDFWFAIYADADEWRAHISNTGAPIEDLEASVLVNFKTVFANCGVLVGANG
jgi:hypothetical protein